jgi:hypothetical protein
VDSQRSVIPALQRESGKPAMMPVVITGLVYLPSSLFNQSVGAISDRDPCSDLGQLQEFASAGVTTAHW